jgi:hypothetical protein
VVEEDVDGGGVGLVRSITDESCGGNCAFGEMDEARHGRSGTGDSCLMTWGGESNRWPLSSGSSDSLPKALVSDLTPES